MNIIAIGFLLLFAYIFGMLHHSIIARRRLGETWVQIMLSDSQHRREKKQLRAALRAQVNTDTGTVGEAEVETKVEPAPAPVSEPDEATVQITSRIYKPGTPHVPTQIVEVDTNSEVPIEPTSIPEVQSQVPAVPVPVLVEPATIIAPSAPTARSTQRQLIEQAVKSSVVETLPHETEEPPTATITLDVEASLRTEVPEGIDRNVMLKQRDGVLRTLDAHMVMARNSGNQDRILRLSAAMDEIRHSEIEVLLGRGLSLTKGTSMHACKKCQETLVKGAIAVLKDHLQVAEANQNEGGIKSLKAGINDLTVLNTDSIYSRGQLAQRAEAKSEVAA